MNRTRLTRTVAGTLALFSLALASCSDNPTSSTSQAGTFEGTASALGNGTARSYVTVDAAGKPTEVGLILTAAALQGLSTDGSQHSELDLTFPSQISTTPFDHIGLNWAPVGHEPPGVYDQPHFDMHFYAISQATQHAITGVGADSAKMFSTPAAQYVPAGYINPGLGVPMMGLHWVDPSSPEFHGQTFTHTMIWGSYDGSFAFIEPMITRAYLLSNPNVTDTLKLPAAYARTGLYYPTTTTIRYDAAKQEYRIALGGMTLR